jgi:peroxiredoxin (alkyl hydroperoxide reductase subunit C)
VTSVEETRIPLIGDRFPDLQVRTTMGKMRLPEAFANKWFILFSHPADFTPVCTTEFVGFNRRFDELKALDCALIGLSVDQIFAHIQWVEWMREHLKEDIQFPVIADSTGRVANALGVIHPNKATNTVRAVFFVDPKAIIRAILYYPQELGRNMDEIVRMVKGLQTCDREGVSLPSDWPHNELLKDRVIVHPPLDVKSARSRPAEYECYDWWFCTKKL